MLSFWNFETSSKDATLLPIVGTFLGPVELATVHVECHTHTPFGLIRPRPSIALACVDESFQLRAIHIDPHDSHSLAIRPVEHSVFLVPLELLWRMGGAFGNDCGYIGAVEVCAHDGSVIGVRYPHVRP